MGETHVSTWTIDAESLGLGHPFLILAPRCATSVAAFAVGTETWAAV